MDMIESNSIDVAVTTWVMCSVRDIPAVLKQIHRVLAPVRTYKVRARADVFVVVVVSTYRLL